MTFRLFSALCLIGLRLAFSQPANAQKPRLEVGQSEVAEPTGTDQTYVVPFFIKNTPPGVSYTVTVDDRQEGTANSPQDYELLSTTAPVAATATLAIPNCVNGQFSLRIKHDALNHHNRTVVLRLRALPAAADTMLFYVPTITIQALAEPAGVASPVSRPIREFKIDSLHASLKIFTGSNFDFFGDQTFKKFAGDLAVHLPDLWATGKRQRLRLGLNMGITYFHYSKADTANGNIQAENVLAKPYEPIIIGKTRYATNIYALNTHTDLRNWGYYGQLLIGRGEQSTTRNGVRTYLTLHGEVLSSVATTTFDKKLLRTDSLTLNNSRAVFQRGGLIQTEQTYQMWDGYFGIGPSFYYYQSSLLEAYGQLILGISSYNPKRTTTLENIAGTNSYLLSQQVDKGPWSGFYLVRARVTERVTKLSGTAGIEVRGIFPRYDPFVAAYLGIQIDLKNFFK